MIRPVSLSELAQHHGGVLLHPDASFERVSTDTRTLRRGDLFVALRGPNFDANDMLQEAAHCGAVGLVGERPAPDLSLPQLVVEDSLAALTDLAGFNRSLYTGKLVALTGSNGKTTVKEMLRAILEGIAPTHATHGNLNNHIGVPLTLLQLEGRHRFAVIEMGASGPGEIEPLSRLAQPDVALVNNVAPAHLEGFGSIEAVRQTKGAIYAGLGENGVAIVNLDCPEAAKYESELESVRVLRFSAAGRERADLFARDVQQDLDSIRFLLCRSRESLPVRVGVLGRHNVANALAAATCAVALGASLEIVTAGLERFQPVAGRLHAVRLPGGNLLIDDSYNANPASVGSAIETLAAMPGRRVLVLGDMAELGNEAESWHRKMGESAREQGIDALYAVGPLSRPAVDAFGGAGHHFASRRALTEALLDLSKSGHVLLVKGSRSARMDEVVRALREGEVACCTG